MQYQPLADINQSIISAYPEASALYIGCLRERVFVTSASRKLNIKWPKDARIAVLLTFDTQGRVDHIYEPHPNGKTNYREVTVREYDTIEGVWRLFDVMDKHGIKGTFPTCGRTAELYPEVVKQIVQGGHEIAAHAYDHEKLYTLTRTQERHVMLKTIAAIERATGIRPQGWRSPWYWSTSSTLELNIELGLKWNSDYHNADIPYVIEWNGKRIVEIPPSKDDWKLYDVRTFNGRLMLDSLKDEFEVLYREAEDKPNRFIVTLHPSISGRPEKSKYFSELIEYIRGFDHVWFARCIEVAEWCAETFPVVKYSKGMSRPLNPYLGSFR